MVGRNIVLASLLFVLCGAVASAGGSCTSGFPDRIGNGWCDAENNNDECNYDGDDCCECEYDSRPDFFLEEHFLFCRNPNSNCQDSRADKFSSCNGDMIDLGDGYCDPRNNNEACGDDGGDCGGNVVGSYTSSVDTFSSSPCEGSDASCSHHSYDCTDGYIEGLEDGFCDQANNNEECGYDDGDCCDCSGDFSSSSGFPLCLNPSPQCDNDAEIESQLDCTDGSLDTIGDGRCDMDNNYEGCLYDGGDCCSCTCTTNDCGATTFNCSDPNAADPEGHICDQSPPTLFDCPTDVQLEWIVDSPSTAQELAEHVSCSGESFNVKWMGNVIVEQTIAIFDGTFLNVTGGDSDAVIDGDGKTRLFAVLNASLHLQNVAVMNGSANYGGGIAASRSTVTVDRASFVGNNASSGGALYLSSGATVSFDGATTFSRNTASEHGGALYMSSGSSAVWTGASYFDFNSAEKSGGAMYLWQGSSAYWSAESRFVNNTAQTNGGVMYLGLNSRVVWTAASSFEENRAFTSDGGVLYVRGGGTAVWTGTSYFFANTAQSDGGAVYATNNGSLSWSKSVMFANNTAEDGGAVFLTNGATIEWNGETFFFFNYADLDGGAVGSRALDSELTSSDHGDFQIVNDIESRITFRGIATFIKNRCGANGGGIALVQSLFIYFESENVTFSQNEAKIAGGGAFVAGTGIGVHFNNVTFTNNTAQTGGGVYATGSGTAVTVDEHDEQIENPTVFNECTFVENFAYATGGGVDSSSGRDIFGNSTFERNNARVGGALRLAGTAVVENCSFIENISELEGGPAVSNVGYMENVTGSSFIHNMFDCDPEHFLDYNNTNGLFETVCSGCSGDCSDCDFGEKRDTPTCTSLSQKRIEHATSPGFITTIDEIVIDVGFWRATNTSINVYECFNSKACRGGVTGNPGYCDDGYEGPYCSVCRTNYVTSLSYTCRECSGRDVSISVSIGLGILFFAAILVILSYLVSADVGGTGRGIVDRATRWIPTQSVKIIIVAWQILTQFASVANVTFPNVYQKLLDGVDLLNFDLSWVVSAGCFLEVDFHDRLLWTTVGPAVIMCLLGLTYAIAIQRNRGLPEIALRNARDKHVSMALLVTFLVYSSVSSVVFQMFACDELDDGNRYLRADYTIECDSPKHKFFEVYASVMIVIYPVGIPALYTGLLLKDRRLLQGGKGREDSLVVRPTSGLWQPYRPQRFYYEVIECARRILLAGVVVFIYPNTAAQIAVTLAIAVVFVFVSEGMTPYESPWDTWISRIGHAVIFASMYLALLLKVDVSGDDNSSQKTFETILVAAHGSMILAVGLEAIAMAFSVKKERQEKENQAPNHAPGVTSKPSSTWTIKSACVEDDEDCKEA